MRYLALALITLALVPDSAAAFVSIGQTSTSPGTCTQPNQFFWQHSSAGPSYTIPSNGVLTTWFTDSGGASGFSERLVVIREGSPNVLVGASSYQLSPSVGIGYPARISVRAGDRVGLESPDSSNFPCAFTTSDPGDSVRTASDPTFGSLTTIPADLEINAAAIVEPDADGDGFGDETQDYCPENPARHDQCGEDLALTMTVDKASVAIGETLTYTIQVKNNSPRDVRHVFVTDTLPGRLAFVSGCNQICTIDKLSSGAARTVTIIAQAKQFGDALNTARVLGVDPNPANNVASAKVAVRPPLFPGVGVSSKVLRGSHGVVKLTMSCPAGIAGGCYGTVVVRTATKVAIPSARPKKKILKLGSARFRFAAGTSASVRVKLSRRGRKLLARKRTVRAVAIFKAHDGANQTKVTAAHLKLKVQRRRHR